MKNDRLKLIPLDPEKLKQIPFWGTPVACPAAGDPCALTQCPNYPYAFQQALKNPANSERAMKNALGRRGTDMELMKLPEAEMSSEELAEIIEESRQRCRERATRLEKRSRGKFREKDCHQIRITHQS